MQLPWRGWPMQAAGRIMDKAEAEMAAALSILLSLRFFHVASDEPIDVIMDTVSGEKKVAAKQDIEAGQLHLPPCIPKALKIIKRCTHPQRVGTTVSLYRKEDDSEALKHHSADQRKESSALSCGRGSALSCGRGRSGRSDREHARQVLHCSRGRLAEGRHNC